jgi:hypothetical protein
MGRLGLPDIALDDEIEARGGLEKALTFRSRSICRCWSVQVRQIGVLPFGSLEGLVQVCQGSGLGCQPAAGLGHPGEKAQRR